MKAFRAIAIIIALGLVTLLTVFLIRVGKGTTAVSKSITISNGQIVQWYLPSEKEGRAHVEVKVNGGSLKDYTNGCILIKGKANATGKKISGDEIQNKKKTSFSLPFYEGDSNYIQFVGSGINNVQIEVKVYTYSWKKILDEGWFENGKDYGIK